MYCKSCGHRNTDDARYCAQCGTGLEQAGDDTTISLPADEFHDEESIPDLDGLQPGQALLIIRQGIKAGSTFLLAKEVTVAGRSPDSDLFLDDVTVSRRHAEILREGARFVVKDAGSLNGTYVNRERVDVAELVSGDELQIGKFKLVFRSAPVEADA